MHVMHATINYALASPRQLAGWGQGMQVIKSCEIKRGLTRLWPPTGCRWGWQPNNIWRKLFSYW